MYPSSHLCFFFFQAEDGIRDAQESRGLGDVYKRQSPPYAEQRKEQYGGVPTAEYVAWWEAVQANVKANLAQDGSFFVNIKPHCEDGERVLYVFDLVLAMRRRWGWRFVDELCWLRSGVPGEWANRFKNGFEPLYQFCVDGSMKFRAKNVTHESDHARRGRGGCLLYTSDAADDLHCVDLGGPGIIKKKNLITQL